MSIPYADVSNLVVSRVLEILHIFILFIKEDENTLMWFGDKRANRKYTLLRRGGHYTLIRTNDLEVDFTQFHTAGYTDGVEIGENGEGRGTYVYKITRVCKGKPTAFRLSNKSHETGYVLGTKRNALMTMDPYNGEIYVESDNNIYEDITLTLDIYDRDAASKMEFRDEQKAKKKAFKEQSDEGLIGEPCSKLYCNVKVTANRQ